MIIALRKGLIEQLDERKVTGLTRSYPSLFLGVPLEREDGQGRTWLCYEDDRFTPKQVALLASMSANDETLQTYDVSDYIDNETGEVLDVEALHADLAGVFLGAPHSLTHPEEYDSLREAYEAQDNGTLAAKMQLLEDLPEAST
jgi:hypothetical protein